MFSRGSGGRLYWNWYTVWQVAHLDTQYRLWSHCGTKTGRCILFSCYTQVNKGTNGLAVENSPCKRKRIRLIEKANKMKRLHKPWQNKANRVWKSLIAVSWAIPFWFEPCTTGTGKQAYIFIYLIVDLYTSISINQVVKKMNLIWRDVIQMWGSTLEKQFKVRIIQKLILKKRYINKRNVNRTINSFLSIYVTFYEFMSKCIFNNGIQ